MDGRTPDSARTGGRHEFKGRPRTRALGGREASARCILSAAFSRRPVLLLILSRSSFQATLCLMDGRARRTKGQNEAVLEGDDQRGATNMPKAIYHRAEHGAYVKKSRAAHRRCKAVARGRGK